MECREITVQQMIDWLKKQPKDNRLLVGELVKGCLNKEYKLFYNLGIGYGNNETIIGIETYEKVEDSITKGQQNIIKFIQDILQVSFYGESYNDADKFIKQYKKQAEYNYRNYNYKGADKYDKFQKSDDWYERNTPDMYGVPNH